jgi:hypothetical protein
MSADVCGLLSSSLAHPQSMALSVLVLMEMLKALSAVSLDTSLLKFPPWKNSMLVAGTILPLLLHLLFMYVPALSSILRLQPLSLREWKVIVAFAAPILALEEILKYFGRSRNTGVHYSLSSSSENDNAEKTFCNNTNETSYIGNSINE